MEYLKQGCLKKRILLIALGSPFLDSGFVFPYLGILYLAAVGKSLGFNVKYLDKSDFNIVNEILKESTFLYNDELTVENADICKYFDFVCISCLTPQAKQAYLLNDFIKDNCPKTKVIIGGPHPNSYLDECVREEFDIISLGDGERIFKTILTKLYTILR